MPEATTTFEWQRLIRRARLQSSTKLVALALSTYANPDGSRAYPGVERLALVTKLSTKTVRNGLSALREVGLIDRVVEGARNGRRGLADEYALRFPDGLDERIHMLSPGESAASEECSEDCTHPRSPVTTSGDRAGKRRARRTDQGNSVPRSGEMVSGSGEIASAIRGSEFPPPTQHLPLYLAIDQSSAPVENATTEREAAGPTGNVNVISLLIDRRAQ